MLEQKYRRYKWAKILWVMLAFCVTFVIMTGVEPPYVSPPPIPASYMPLVLIFGGGIVGFAGFWVLGTRQERVRRKAWRRANLTPDGEDAYRGTVRGRRVHVSEDTWRDPMKDDNGSQSATVIETEMRRPAEEGFIVDTASSSQMSILADADPTHVLVEDDHIAVVGESEEMARALISGRSREALGALDAIGTFRVGRSSNVIKDPVGTGLQSIFGNEAVETGLGGNASTVTHKLKGLILAPDELKRQMNAVAAVANAYETAAVEVGYESR